MPLVLFVGLPASGKTTRAKQLLSHLQQHLFPQQATATDDSKQPKSSPSSNSSPPTASSVKSSSSSPSSTTDDGKDSSGADQLAALTLTNPTASQLTDTDALQAVSATSPAPSSSFTRSKAPPKSASTSHSSLSTPSSSSTPISELLLINYESLLLTRSAFYASAQSEKAGRSAVRASVERHLTSSRVLLVDYINDIKGFRYELWCRARELATTYCVVYCDVPRDRCVEWNRLRPAEEQYSDAVYDSHRTHSMTDLLGRMEVPNGTKRWDEPLFTVNENDAMPLEQITQWVLHGKQQSPGLATLPAHLEDISYLQTLERTVNAISQSLVDRQQRQLIQPGDSVHVEASAVRLQLVRAVKYAELKRIQGQFVKMARLRPMQGEAAIATSFVNHLQNALNY